MKKTIKTIPGLFLVVFFSFNLAAQHQSGSGWIVKKPFSSEAFIENKGQFDNPDGQKEENILYAIKNGGLNVYFTPIGLSYHVLNVASKFKNKKVEEEIMEESEEALRRNGKINSSRLKKYYTDKSAYINIRWEGADPRAQLIVSDKEPDYYTYSKVENGALVPVMAFAFKKLTYKNIYPHIDVEYYFPDNSTEELGVKYNIVVHPGGDLSNVKMKYSGMKNISLDTKGNIVVEIPDGNITDHDPRFSYVGGTSNQLKVNFVLQEQTVSFRSPDYDKSQQLVIDPFVSIWNTSPGFTNVNSGYTIRVDYFRNVYVMGGGSPPGGIPTGGTYQVKKISPTGTLLWTYTTPPVAGPWYGDMTVTRSGTAFLGFGLGYQTSPIVTGPLYKLGNNGVLISSKSIGVVEPWRLSYNQALNNGTIWVGGGSSNGTHLYRTDTTVVTAVQYGPWGSTNQYEDIIYLAQDKSGSFVYCTNAPQSGTASSATASYMVKAASGTPGTALWKVPEPSPVQEIGQMSFLRGGAAPPSGRGWSTGFNGMVVCDCHVYTYDGNIIRSYNSASGALVNTVLTGGTFDKHAGIAADSCCRIYVGDANKVKRYTSSLAFDVNIPVAGEVYDLVLDPVNQGILYVTGQGFVQRIDSMGSCVHTPCVSVPTVTAVGGSVCAGVCTSVTASGSGGSSPYAYLWNPSGQTTSSINVCPSVTTVYSVTITDATSATATSTATVTITSPPVATVTNPLTVCAGSSATITAGGGGTYSWIPTGQTSASITVAPTATTNYSVIVTNASGCKDTATTTVAISPGINPTVTPSIICAGDMATITAAGGNTYSWIPGGQTTSSITASPSTTTSYTVLVTAGSCSATAVATVTVSTSISASVSGNTSICAGSSTTLTAGGGSSFSWSDGSTTASIVITPTSGSSYSVVVSSGTCKDSTGVTITVSPVPTAGVSSSSICAGVAATLTATGGGNYSWSPGGSTSPSITVNPTATTNYTVTVSNAGGCTDTAVATVSVSSSPTVAITGTTSLCSGQSTVLTATGGGTYLWNTSATSAAITITPPSSTTYTVTVTNAGGCTSTSTVTVNVTPTPVASISAASTICAGTSATLTAGGGGNYLWSPGAGTSPSITVSPAATTSYSVIVSNGACADTASVIVTVSPSPTVTVSGNTLLCKGDATTLTATGGGTYNWSNGSTSPSISLTPASSASYTVTVTNAGGCTSTATVAVTVSNPPLAGVNSTTICAGQTTTLTATGGGNYLWDNGQTTASITVNPATTTNYTVIVSIGSCADTATSSITVQPMPVATAQSNVIINIGDNTTLLASGGGTYSWVPAYGLSNPYISDPVAAPEVTTDYCVYVTGPGGCVDSACLRVTVEYNCKPIYVPNAFSPNSDGENDILYVYGNCIKEMKFIIYNRWGEKVYEGTDPKAGWNGYFRDKIEDTAVFAFYLEYTLITGTKGNKKGNVSLVR